MGTVEALRQERNGRTIPLQRFLAEYKDDVKICYGFVEGKDDPSYYRRIINYKIDKDCKIILYSTNGKGNVKYVFDEIHKNKNVSNDRIVYFMDRDLSNVIKDDNIIIDSHVYITDNYSIENDILNSDTLEFVMQDLLGFCTTPIEDVEKAKKLYDEQLLNFETKMLPIMANIVIWKRNNVKPAYYNNLKIRDLFKIKDGGLCQIYTDVETIQKFYQYSQVDYSSYNKTCEDNVIIELKEKNLVHQILRGKYLAMFFILFCNFIYNNFSTIGIIKTNKGRQLNDNDIMETIAPRARVPLSLEKFIDSTIVQYYKILAV